MGWLARKNWKTSSKRWKQHQQRMAWKSAQRKQRSCQTMRMASQKNIKVKGYNLETETNFKYLGAIMTDEGTKREVLSRIAQATSALTKLKTVWKDRKITSKHRIQILRLIVTSTFLYACETWTLTAELERRIQTFEMRCYRKIFGISFRDRITNEDVRNRVRAAIGPHDDLLSIVKTRKLRWYGHVTRATGLANTIMQGTVPGGRRRGRPKKKKKKMLARQHQGMDGAASRQDPETSRRQRRLEKDHQNIIMWCPYSPPTAKGC